MSVLLSVCQPEGYRQSEQNSVLVLVMALPLLMLWWTVTVCVRHQRPL